MALAKLCACACGGAVIGGGAVHVAESRAERSYMSKQPVAAKRVIKKRVVKRPAVRKRIVRRTVTTTAQCQPQVVTVTP